MKNIKVFRKLLSVVSAGLIACSGGIVRNYADALSAEKIVKLCFNEINSYNIRTISRHLMKFEIDETDLLGGLDVKNYSEFLNSIDSDESKKSFKDQYDNDEGKKDSADFLLFINLINSVSSGPKKKLIYRLLSMRNNNEHKNDKVVAQDFDRSFETQICDILVEAGKKHAKKA